MAKDKLIFITGILLSILIISTSAFLYYKKIKTIPVNTEKDVAVTLTPEPTATPKISYKDKEIQILNGSGIKGLAKTYAEKLTKLGYSKVTTGNNSEITTGNILQAPTDFGKEIELENYKFEKSESVKVIIGKINNK